MVSTNGLDGCVLLPEGAAAGALGGSLVEWQGGKGTEICSPWIKVMLQTMKVIGVGYPSGKELSSSPASHHVPIPVSPREILCRPQVLVGWKSTTSPSLSSALPWVLCLQPSPCGIFLWPQM